MGGVCFGAGLGITLFGIMYMFIHDGMVHRRFPVSNAPKAHQPQDLAWSPGLYCILLGMCSACCADSALAESARASTFLYTCEGVLL